jgi:cold shock CspA family protein
MAVAEREGIIVRVNDSAGFGYVQEENSTRQFIFGFDKVRGYQGQPASQLRLRDGVRVHFQLEDEVVRHVEPL